VELDMEICSNSIAMTLKETAAGGSKIKELVQGINLLDIGDARGEWMCCTIDRTVNKARIRGQPDIREPLWTGIRRTLRRQNTCYVCTIE
jgi:hypothetical protein